MIVAGQPHDLSGHLRRHVAQQLLASSIELVDAEEAVNVLRGALFSAVSVAPSVLAAIPTSAAATNTATTAAMATAAAAAAATRSELAAGGA